MSMHTAAVSSHFLSSGCQLYALFLDKPVLQYCHAPGHMHGLNDAAPGLMATMQRTGNAMQSWHIVASGNQRVLKVDTLCRQCTLCATHSPNTREICPFVMKQLLIACTLLLICL